MTRARPLVRLALAALLALGIAACGDDGARPASQRTDVDQLLQDTFAGGREVTSGRLDLRLRVEARGAAARGLPGPVALRLRGPFASEGAGRLPRFALAAELDGGLLRIDAGATSTGDAGYVRFAGEDYAVPGVLFRQLQAAYEEAQRQGGSFAALGIDPRRWLTDAQNAGEATVGDVETIKITGRVDVRALLDDIDTALGRAAALGLPHAGSLPERLTPAQRERAERAVERARVEIFTGRDDRILRRLRVDLRVADEREGGADVDLDLTLTEVNDEQQIEAPSDPRPFDELTEQLGGLGFGLDGLLTP
jgi:hypothetical protein